MKNKLFVLLVISMTMSCQKEEVPCCDNTGKLIYNLINIKTNELYTKQFKAVCNKSMLEQQELAKETFSTTDSILGAYWKCL